MLLAYGSYETAAVELASRLQDVCAGMERERLTPETPLLLAHESFLRYLPPPSAQRRMLAALRQVDLERTETAFRKALDEEGLDEEYFEFTFALLREHRLRAGTDRAVLPSDLDGTPLWRYLRRFVSRKRLLIDLREPLPAGLSFPVTLAAPAYDRSETIRAAAGDELDRDRLFGL